MKKLLTTTLILMLAAAGAPCVYGTNGDNLIGVGPNSWAMGGVGIAYPTAAKAPTAAARNAGAKARAWVGLLKVIKNIMATATAIVF